MARDVLLGIRAGTLGWASNRLPRLEWLGRAAAFCFVMAIAAATYVTGEWQGEIGSQLARAARQHFATQQFSGIALSGILAGLWLVWLTLKPLAILAAFFAVEWLLAGPPRNWSNSLLCLSAQLGLVVLYYFINPWLQLVLPTDALKPLLTLGDDHLPALLAPLAPALLLTAMLALYGLAGYWTHRAQHQIPILWRFHRVHHSIPHMDAVNDVAHPVDAIGDRIGIILISALIGFEYETTALLFAFQSIRGRLLHSRAPINFGPLGKIFVDNRFHLSHHSVREKYWDCNYGGAIILYDRMFGSYVEPDWKVLEETGLADTAHPRNLWQFFTARLDDRTSDKAGHLQPA